MFFRYTKHQKHFRPDIFGLRRQTSLRKHELSQVQPEYIRLACCIFIPVFDYLEMLFIRLHPFINHAATSFFKDPCFGEVRLSGNFLSSSRFLYSIMQAETPFTVTMCFLADDLMINESRSDIT